MKEFKGTPGNWSYDAEMKWIYSYNCLYICDVLNKDDGVLMAASPRLLSALQSLVNIYDDKSGRQWTTSTKRRALDEAHAAIAQALGETE